MLFTFDSGKKEVNCFICSIVLSLIVADVANQLKFAVLPRLLVRDSESPIDLFQTNPNQVRYLLATYS